MGLIRKLPSWRYQAEYTLDYVKKRASFDTRREAEIFLSNIRLERFTEHVVERVSISSAVERFRKECGKKHSHVHRMALLRFVDYFECRSRVKLNTIDKVKRSHMMGLRSELLNIPLSNSTVNLYFRIYKPLFNYCRDMEWTNEDPLRSLQSLEQSSKKPKIWEEWQQRAFIESFSGVMREILFYFWLTGIRPTSICRHKYEDFNEEFRTIKAYSFKSRGGRLVETVHYLGEDVAQFLIAKRTRDQSLGFGRSSDFIFHLNGKPYRAGTFSTAAHVKLNEFKKFDNSFECLTVYKFRHTWVTDVAKREGLDRASEGIGHKSRTTTERHYYRPDNELVARAVRSVVDKKSVSFDEIGKAKRVMKLVGV